MALRATCSGIVNIRQTTTHREEGACVEGEARVRTQTTVWESGHG